uniref:Uncharacterized protein n=1 Tax=Octopus bimaculoides TaxID=37653 RepID=A0A0L8I790_OCTBM
MIDSKRNQEKKKMEKERRRKRLDKLESENVNRKRYRKETRNEKLGWNKEKKFGDSRRKKGLGEGQRMEAIRGLKTTKGRLEIWHKRY